MPTPPAPAELHRLAGRALERAGRRAQVTACWELTGRSPAVAGAHETWVEVVGLDGGRGVARTTRLDDEGLEEVAERARRAATGDPPAELPEPVPGRPHEGWDPQVATDPASLETAAAGAPEHARSLWRLGAARTCIRSSAGVDAFEQRSYAELTLARATGRHTQTLLTAASGTRRLDAASLFRLMEEPPADAPLPAPAGELPVVLGPQAVAVVLDLVRPHFGALAAAGGGEVVGRLGRRVVAPCINLSDSPRYPATLPRTYDAEGVPRQPLPLVQDGVAHRVVRDSATPGGPSTGHATEPFASAPSPDHLVLVGGGAADEEELARRLDDGVHIAALSADGTVALGARAIEGGRLGAPLMDAEVSVDALTVLASAQALTMGQRLIPTRDDSARTIGASVCPGLRATAGIVFA